MDYKPRYKNYDIYNGGLIVQQLKNTDYTEGFTTDISKTQEHILDFINYYGEVCRKLVINNSGKDTGKIRGGIVKLKDRDFIQAENKGRSQTLSLTEKGKKHL